MIISPGCTRARDHSTLNLFHLSLIYCSHGLFVAIFTVSAQPDISICHPQVIEMRMPGCVMVEIAHFSLPSVRVVLRSRRPAETRV